MIEVFDCIRGLRRSPGSRRDTPCASRCAPTWWALWRLPRPSSPSEPPRSGQGEKNRHRGRLQGRPLTRSLADFAKLVELFDEHEVSFVSVTQSSTPRPAWEG